MESDIWSQRREGNMRLEEWSLRMGREPGQKESHLVMQTKRDKDNNRTRSIKTRMIRDISSRTQ